MKRRLSKYIVFGIIFCLCFAFVFLGCKDPLDDFKKDKVTSKEWDAAIDAIYTSFSDMVGDNFKIEISTEKEVSDSVATEYSSCELIAISCGEIEYFKEKRVERKILKSGVVESESETVSERYLERTQGGVFEYLYENEEWVKKKSETAYGSIVFERVSSINEQYWQIFDQSLPDYYRNKGGYCDWFSSTKLGDFTCLYKMKDKKVASISAKIKSGGVTYMYEGEENILFLYDYGKQEITLPK